MPNTAFASVTRLISNNKAVAALLAPAITGLGGVVTSYILTGVWDATETRVVFAGLVAGLVAAGATYLTPAGLAEVEGATPVDVDVEDEHPVDEPTQPLGMDPARPNES